MFRFDKEFRDELAKGWPILIIAFTCFLFGFAAPAFALPFIYPEVIREFGWTREQATLLASSKYAVGALSALVAGRLVDYFGAWPSLIVTISLGGIALVSFLWINDLTAYYMVGVLLGVAAGGTMVSIKVLISRAFHASQGSAMGLALIGTVVGSMVVPLVAVYATEIWGWRNAIAALSSGIWLVAIPLLIFGMFAKSMAYGRKALPAPVKKKAKDSSLGYLVREPRFWLIGVAVFIVAMVDQAFTQHQVMIFSDMGLSKEYIALGVSALGLAGIFTRTLVGNILDSTSNRGLCVLWMVLSGSVILAFALVNPLVFMAFIVLRAIGHSAVLLDTTVMTKHVYGPARLGTLIGVFTAMVSAGFAIGPWLMGRLYDISGSYTTSFILFAILPLVASALIWNVKPVFWLQLKAEKSENEQAAKSIATKVAKAAG